MKVLIVAIAKAIILVLTSIHSIPLF